MGEVRETTAAGRRKAVAERRHRVDQRRRAIAERFDAVTAQDLRELVEAADLSKVRAANLLGISIKTYALYASGGRPIPRAVAALARLLFDTEHQDSILAWAFDALADKAPSP